jgi:hypothetical protein
VTHTVKIDGTPPMVMVSALPGTLPSGLPLVTVQGTAVVKDTRGATVGSTGFTCFDTRGLKLSLNGLDIGGSGVAGLTYAATGAQAIPSTTVNGATAQVALTASGVSTITYSGADSAGNLSTSSRQTVIVGLGFACAAPTPTFTVPAHGILTVTGTAVANGRSYPFNQSITF